MRTLFKTILIILFSSSAAFASEKESFDFFKNYNSDYQEMMRIKSTSKTKTRGPASIEIGVREIQIEKSFFQNKWEKYSNLSDEVRRSVIKKFNDKDMIYSLDQMLTFIKKNKASLTREERVKAAELRGQYDALLSWN